MFLKYRSGPVALLLKSLWWLSIADHRKGPLSLWVPQPSWFGLSPFLVYLLLLVFTSSDPEWAVTCSLNLLQALDSLNPCSLCLSQTLWDTHILTWFHWVHISVSVVRDQALESHQLETDSRFCHLLCGQVIESSTWISSSLTGTLGEAPAQWLSGKDSTCRRCGLDPWVRKILWRRKWQPTPVFLPRQSHRQGSLVGYSP